MCSVGETFEIKADVYASRKTKAKARLYQGETLNGLDGIKDVDLAPGLSVAELDALIGKRDYKRFLNFRNEVYREKGMKKNPPSREEALRLMSENPNLVRRPLLVKGKSIVIGFDKDAMKEMAG